MYTLLCNNNNSFGENKKGQATNFSDLSLMVTPTGFEPISSEPESEILSIELGGLSIHRFAISFFSRILPLPAAKIVKEIIHLSLFIGGF
jgi:hypothetical protein